MLLLKKEQTASAGLGPSSYAPIAKALSVLPDDSKAKLRVKFDIADFVATEAFTKYLSICKLKEHHGVDVGTSYTNEVAGKSFCHYIADHVKEGGLITMPIKGKNFFLAQDGSTDAGNIDNELFLVLW